MKIHIIGSGSPSPHKDAYGSAFLLDIGADLALVDCGPASTYKMALMEISPPKIHHVFLTHHHYDHNVDFPCFALTRWARWDLSSGVELPLNVYGPPPTCIFVERLLGRDGAFFDDWHSRIVHPGGSVRPRQKPPPAVLSRDVGPGPVAKTDSWTASAERVHHVEPTLESLAYRFETQEGSVLFTGDCADCLELRRFAKGVDTLVIACTHFGRSRNAAYASVITGTEEVSEIAKECGARRVILTHANPTFGRSDNKERAIAEIAKTYDGEILFPNELTTVEIE